MKTCDKSLCNQFPITGVKAPSNYVKINEWRKLAFLPDVYKPKDILEAEDTSSLKGTYYCQNCFNGFKEKIDNFYDSLNLKVQIKCGKCESFKEINDKEPYKCPDCQEILKRPETTIQEVKRDEELEDGDTFTIEYTSNDGRFQCLACGENVKLDLDSDLHYTEDETEFYCHNCDEEYKVSGNINWTFEIKKIV